MTEPFILHHYEQSPYAEKIRLMFGLTNSRWYSLTSPLWPPRPNVDPLAGGYRRIPVAQLGADIFCDTSLIAAELAEAGDSPQLDPSRVEGEALALMQLAEGPAFFAAIRAVPPLKLLGMMLFQFGPVGTYKFVQDRASMTRSGNSSAPAPEAARAVLATLFERLEQCLQTQSWIEGDAPTVADLAVYHPIWLHLNCKGKIPPGATATQAWFDRVGAIGHGQPENITQAEAFAAARSAPRPLPASVPSAEGVDVGAAVSVAPADYGVVPVEGALAALTPQRIIVARDTPEFGTVHVHFPRQGYQLTAR